MPRPGPRLTSMSEYTLVGVAPPGIRPSHTVTTPSYKVLASNAIGLRISPPMSHRDAESVADAWRKAGWTNAGTFPVGV
jgi:hypothetical protein